jgi:cardiolipin synthase
MSTLLGMLGAVILTVAYFVIARRRHTESVAVDLDQLPAVEDGLVTFAGLTGGAAVHRGNAATVVHNGDLFDRMEADIRAARHTIHLETFVWSSGVLERRFVDLLRERAADGLKVRVLIDAVGASKASRTELRRLREGKVELIVYRAPRRFNLRRLNHRTHRKLLIVDGAIGYTFGHGIADQWLGGGEDPAHWRDTGVRLEGPVVNSLQSVFMEHWIEETHAAPTGQGCFPELAGKGDVAAHVVSSDAGEVVSSVALLYTLAIASARKEIVIQNPYFVPGKGVVMLLKTMVKRGVQVHLMVPSRHSDSPFVRRASCYLYAGLLEAGVRVYEFEPTLCHQKIVVVDGRWSHIGSTNFDARSLALNEEVGVGLLDERIASDLKAAFEVDLKSSKEIHLSQWKKRGKRRQFFEWCAYQLHEQL